MSYILLAEFTYILKANCFMMDHVSSLKDVTSFPVGKLPFPSKTWGNAK